MNNSLLKLLQFFVILSFSTCIYSQEYEWRVEPSLESYIYQDGKKPCDCNSFYNNDIFFMVGSNQCTYLINSSGITKLDSVDRFLLTRRKSNSTIVEHKNTAYLFDINNGLHPKNGLGIDFETIAQNHNSYRQFYDHFLIKSNDSLFIGNIKSGKSKFIAKAQLAHIANESYVLFKDDEFHSDGNFYIYDIESEKISEFSSGSLDCYNGMFDKDMLLCDKIGTNIVGDYKLRNTKLKKIIPAGSKLLNFKQNNYFTYLNFENLNSQKTSILYNHFTKKIIEGEFEEVLLSENGLAAISHQGAYSIFDLNGLKKTPHSIHSVDEDFLTKFLVAKSNEGESTIFDKDNEILISGVFDDIAPINHFLFATKKDEAWGLINNKNKELIPHESLSKGDLGTISVFGKTLIIKRNPNKTLSLHTLEGDKICEVSNQYRPNQNIKYFDYEIWKDVIDSTPPSTLALVNPFNTWVECGVDNEGYRLVDNQGLPISDWFYSITHTDFGGILIVKDFDKKYGILELK